MTMQLKKEGTKLVRSEAEKTLFYNCVEVMYIDYTETTAMSQFASVILKDGTKGIVNIAKLESA